MKKTLIAAIAACAAVAALAMPAGAKNDHDPGAQVSRYEYTVMPVPHTATDVNDGVTGTVRLTALPNGKVQVKERLSGLAPNLPHAQHLHGDIGIPADCPTIAADANHDGFISVLEAASVYGAIQVSLTTTGDTSPGSALALDRFPVADANGNLDFNRNIDVPQAVHDNLGLMHFVVHGIDINGSAAYDGTNPPPELGGAPFEATVPAGCADAG